jgi:hypothetical protein
MIVIIVPLLREPHSCRKSRMRQSPYPCLMILHLSVPKSSHLALCTFRSQIPKSAHTRFVHSRGEFGLCLKSHLLDSGRDLGVLIQLG